MFPRNFCFRLASFPPSLLPLQVWFEYSYIKCFVYVYLRQKILINHASSKLQLANGTKLYPFLSICSNSRSCLNFYKEELLNFSGLISWWVISPGSFLTTQRYGWAFLRFAIVRFFLYPMWEKCTLVLLNAGAILGKNFLNYKMFLLRLFLSPYSAHILAHIRFVFCSMCIEFFCTFAFFLSVF